MMMGVAFAGCVVDGGAVVVTVDEVVVLAGAVVVGRLVEPRGGVVVGGTVVDGGGAGVAETTWPTSIATGSEGRDTAELANTKASAEPITMTSSAMSSTDPLRGAAQVLGPCGRGAPACAVPP